MKLANEAILVWLYNQLGNSVQVNGNTWEYYSDPPENSANRYIWSDVTVLEEIGTKEDFMANYLLEITLVDKASYNYTSKKSLYEVANQISETIALRSGEVDLTEFKILARNFDTFTYSKEIESGEVRHIGKTNFIILAEQK